MWMVLAAVAVAAAPAVAAPPRFFVAGDGRLSIENAHTKERVTVRYRDADSRYDPAALARIRHVFRSRDGGERDVSLRLIEVLSHLQGLAGGDALRLLSGYRSPAYNEDIRQKGAATAGGSLHTEALAADLAFPRAKLTGLWEKVRALDCCGAGVYEANGFLHVDVGRPRFWEPTTSRVEENLSAGNARLFARTEFDRYAAGETITVALHAMTRPPVGIARGARLVGEGGAAVPVGLEADLPERGDCFEAGPGAELRVPAVPALAGGRARLVFETCEPRVERTPAAVETNQIEVRPTERR
jgi:uncharacterized protein YcbK (DUF882 family)